MKKILWAIDAFQSDVSLDKTSVELIRNLAKKTECKIEPVYVLSPEQLNLSVEFTPQLIAHYKPAAEKTLKQVLKNTQIPGLIAPQVLVENAPSLTQTAEALNAYALSTGADLIAVGTHAKKGLARMLLGSFAEALLLHSRVPILTINPKTKSKARDNSILFATDGSPSSEEAFKYLLKLAQDLGTKITLYHYIRNPIDPIIQSGAFLLGGGWVPVNTYVRDESAQIEQELQKMVEKAKKEGIKAEILIDSGYEGITEGILNSAAETKAVMIALAAQSGPITATLIGSISRQVVRSAETPVWVIHTEIQKPKAKLKPKKKSTIRLYS